MKRDMVDNPAQMYDVCVVCALPEEIRAFLAVVQPFCEEQIEAGISPQHKYEYRFATLKNTRGERLMLHVSWLSRYGPQEMVLHLSRILEEYQPRIVIMTGICAGDARLVQLGDLVVAERTFTYDNGKFTLDEQGRRIHLYDTLTYQLDANLLQFLGLFDDWKPLVAHVKRPASLAEPSRRRKRTCHLKPMASGSAVRADHPFEEVRAPVRGTVAIDMEGAAFGLVMSRHPLIPWLIVKGVCNYADGDKNDIFHDYAARVSALYALSFIQAYVTNERLPPSVESSSPRRAEPFVVWNLPSMRNPFFTGREELLSHLHQVLHDNTAVALTQSYALSGLGGIGKTQMAIEYAYRYRNEYHAVLWATANTSETLMTDFVKIAGILNLPQHKDQDQNKAIQAVKRWLEEHEQWLLILDNVDDFSVLSNFLPTKGSGHILLTTRAQATGTLAVSVDVEKMGVDEGILFLLRRAKLLSKDSYLDTAPLPDRWNAQAIVYALDGLPLALDQAGAYIEEM